MIEGLIDFSDWCKLDLRVGQIVKVEDIEGADKLYKLTIDLGELGKRIVCAGLKQHYDKNDLLDKRIILFVNLTPRKMKGIESNGMILAASSDNGTTRVYNHKGCENLQAGPDKSFAKIFTRGKVVLIVPEDDIELGSRVR